MQIFSYKSSKGFTLIELLAVIAIIAILAAMGLVAYTSAQKSGRDARRVSDMKAVQSAFEVWAGENNGQYSSCGAMFDNLQSGEPTDPQDVAPYKYSISCDTSTNTYCACANLENNKGNHSASDCSGSWTSDSTGSYYCVENQQ